MGPKVVDKEEKREAIVAAAAEIFARNGFRAATMDMISRRAGIAKGTTYLYFRGKAELFLAVFDWYVDWMLGEAEREMGSQEGGALEKMNGFMENSLQSLEQIRDMFPLSMEFWAASATGEQRAVFGDHMRQLYVRYRRVVGRLIRQGVQEGVFGPDTDPEAISSALVGTMDGLMVQAWLEPELDIPKTGRVFMETLIRGMAGK